MRKELAYLEGQGFKDYMNDNIYITFIVLIQFDKMIDFDGVRAPFTLQRAQKSIGTLGGGNHFV
ncbi:hypothetical protein ACT453_55640, partial [Bacillus sp. D-CC]